MYRLNTLQKKVLITPDEVIFHAVNEDAVSPKAIRNAIIVAEERFIRPALCYDLYEAIVAAKNIVITEENKAAYQAKFDSSRPPGAQAYTLKAGDLVNNMDELPTPFKTLWAEHLWKLTAECVMMMQVPDSFVQTTTEGMVYKNPPAGPMNTGGVVTPELRSVKWLMDKKLMDRIDPLLEAMHVWLCKQKAANAGAWGLYCKACDCDANGVAYKRKSDLVIGLYDDDETGCGCNA